MVTKQAAAAVALFGRALWSTQGAAGQEPIDGVCDESVRNGCAAGTPNDESFDDIDTGYLWRCDGQYGGANSDKCFRRVPVDGVCDENVRNGCATGIPNDEAFDDIDTGYIWRCDGQYGGTNSDKCFRRVERVENVPVDGVCDDSVRNGCSAGTANDAAIADTASLYQWRCDGEHDGSNSGTCSLAKPTVSCGAPWSPSADAICTSQFLRQTRTCDAGCNDGDCATSRRTSGTKQPSSCEWGSWSQWSAWEACSVSCGGGSQLRSRLRAKTTPEACGGACPGSAVETQSQACNTHDCPIECGDDPWTPAVNTVCEGASFVQTRACNVGCNTNDCSVRRDATGTMPCVVSCGGTWAPEPSTVCSGQSFTQTRSCNAGCNDGDCDTSRNVQGTKPASDCTWGSWSQWSPWGNCTALCDGGTQSRSRTRSKSRTEACGGACPGPAVQIQSQACNTHACPVVCGNDDWSPATSTVCRGQSFTQTRPRCDYRCNTGNCSSTRTATGTKPPSDCQWAPWSQWSAWGACSASCGGGTQSRERTTRKTEVEACGRVCVGIPVERQTRSCNTHACVTCGNAVWSPATTTVCDGQSFTQTRSCAAGCNSGDCSTSRSATGTKRAVDGVWRTGAWQTTGRCRDDCEPVLRTRSVTCDPPSCGGAACDPATKPAERHLMACRPSDPRISCP